MATPTKKNEIASKFIQNAEKKLELCRDEIRKFKGGMNSSDAEDISAAALRQIDGCDLDLRDLTMELCGE